MHIENESADIVTTGDHEFKEIIEEWAPFAWRNLEESRGICERKTLFRMKKEADQARFKGTRMRPMRRRFSCRRRSQSCH